MHPYPPDVAGRCSRCNAPLHWSKRSDATYCSGACRQADYRERREPAARVRVVESVLGRSHPFVFFSSDDDLFLTTWSKPVPCPQCDREVARTWTVRRLTGEITDLCDACGLERYGA